MEEAGPIKLAFLGPLTGPAAALGQEMVGFSKVAVDIFNERTGLDVEFVEGDTEINADVGKIVAEQFVADEDIYVVVGPAGSQVCESTQPVFEGARMAHLTPSCTATFLTDPGTPTFFRPIANEAIQSKTVADVMVDTLGVQSVFMVDDQSTYAVLLNDDLGALLSDAGVENERVSVSQEETDLSSIATSVIASGADVVFFPSQNPGQLGTMIAQLREQGYEGHYFLPDGGFSPEVISIAGDAAEGTYVTSFAGDPNTTESMAPYNERFVAEYTEEFGSFGGSTAMTTFVALDAIETCANAGDLSRACVVDALTNIDLATTPMEVPVTFGAGNQNEAASFALFQVQDGGFHFLSPGEAGVTVEAEPLSVDVPVKLAFLGPLTGPAAALGQEMVGFSKVAVDIFNERTGLDVEFVEGDTEINADVGKIVAEQFVADEDIYVVVGPAGSQVCESTQPVFEGAGMAHLTPSCTATFLTDPGTPTFFRPIANEAIQSKTVADVMVDTLGVQSVFMVDDQSTYAVLLNDDLESTIERCGRGKRARFRLAGRDGLVVHRHLGHRLWRGCGLLPQPEPRPTRDDDRPAA